MDNRLALLGGAPIRSELFPSRNQFGMDARAAVNQVFDYYASIGQDFGTQGFFEKRYTDEFVRFQGGLGYCDAVCSGTAAIYVALGALNLPQGSAVLMSPIADSGCLSAIILNRLIPKLIDTGNGLYNATLEEIESRCDARVSCIFLVHSAGTPIREIEAISEYCRSRKIALLEDCSQCQGAVVNRRRVGGFGDVSVFSTMNTKNHSTGGAGGLIYTRNQAIYNRGRMLADRGKPFHEDGFDPKDPRQLKVPALNLPQDELSCSIGFVTLQKLDRIRIQRVELIQYLNERLSRDSKTCLGLPVTKDDSPFFWPIRFHSIGANCDKNSFTVALAAEGIPINPHYRYLASEWPWAKPYLVDDFHPKNASEMVANSFNLLFHENFSSADMDDIANAILKVERHFLDS